MLFFSQAQCTVTYPVNKLLLGNMNHQKMRGESQQKKSVEEAGSGMCFERKCEGKRDRKPALKVYWSEINAVRNSFQQFQHLPAVIL